MARDNCASRSRHGISGRQNYDPLQARMILEEHEVMNTGRMNHGLVLSKKWSKTRKVMVFGILVSGIVVSVYGCEYLTKLLASRVSAPENLSPESFKEYISPESYKIPFVEFVVPGNAGNKIVGWLMSQRDDELNAPTIVYLSGKRQGIPWLLPRLARLYNTSGCNIMVMHYYKGGILRNPQMVLEASKDMCKAVPAALMKRGIDPSKTIIMGNGVGAEIAIDVMNSLPKGLQGIIVENPRQLPPSSKPRWACLENLRQFIPKWIRKSLTDISETAEEKLSKSTVPLLAFSNEEFTEDVAQRWFTTTRACDRILCTDAGPEFTDPAVVSKRWHHVSQ